MSTYDDVKARVRAMVGMKTMGERTEEASEIIALVQALEVERPASLDALRVAYEDGAMRAMELAHGIRREHEESFKVARFSAAGIVLNGVENYGQALLSQAESAINRHLGERRRKKETP